MREGIQRVGLSDLKRGEGRLEEDRKQSGESVRRKNPLWGIRHHSAELKENGDLIGELGPGLWGPSWRRPGGGGWARLAGVGLKDGRRPRGGLGLGLGWLKWGRVRERSEWRPAGGGGEPAGWWGRRPSGDGERRMGAGSLGRAVTCPGCLSSSAALLRVGGGGAGSG